ncbi:MAG TPA: hypothetical protein EYH24_04945 [Thermococcus paralvinellae]|uniref:tRNA(Phe) 7-((3-amino-3-carboxypropyl)-4-demethylwyosine(37)-N(4))-methyltransferase n=1 Tax=Thermococcus paralvinellae TaxID=582419 RepID=A0A832ZFJ9_9EURY|nr:hypothetical protein [Thermococcus paralvinellae]
MKAKREALISLFTAMREKKVDEDIVELLMLINSIRGVYTTSSCSGRIGIIEEPDLGAKPLSRWLIKEHRPITFEEAKESLKKAQRGFLFLKSQPPIFHIVAESFDVAKKLHELGLASGFKYTTFKALKERILIEINGTEYLTAPLGKDGKILVDDEYLMFAVELGNTMLMRAKSRLPRLKENFEKLRDELGEDELFQEIKTKFQC